MYYNSISVLSLLRHLSQVTSPLKLKYQKEIGVGGHKIFSQAKKPTDFFLIERNKFFACLSKAEPSRDYLKLYNLYYIGNYRIYGGAQCVFYYIFCLKSGGFCLIV